MDKKILGPDGNPIAKTTKSKFNRRNILVSVASFVAALALFFSNFDSILKSINSIVDWFNPSHEINYQYMRLFGALQVPVVLEGINNKKCESLFRTECTIDEINRDKGNQIFRLGFFHFGQALKEWRNDSIDDTSVTKVFVLPDPIWRKEVNENLFNEFQKDPYSKDNRYWKIIYGDSQIATTYLACLDQYNPKHEPQIRQCKEEMREERYSPPANSENLPQVQLYAQKKLSEHLKEIGYLFLVIENKSLSDIRDLEIKYVIVPNEEPEKIWLLNDKVQKEFDKKVKNEVEVKSLYIANIVKNNKALLFLGGYKADRDGYPEKYFTSCMRPLSLSWKQNNRPVKVQLRLPLKERAAKINLSIGWYGQ